MSFLRTNYRLTGNKIELATPGSGGADSGVIFFTYTGTGSGRLYIMFNKGLGPEGSGTYVAAIISTSLVASQGEL
jgi:hypothetical protein